MSYKLIKGGVRRLSDGALILEPQTASFEWRAYKAWRALGNTPEPADPDPIPSNINPAIERERKLKNLRALAREQPSQHQEFFTALIELLEE